MRQRQRLKGRIAIILFLLTGVVLSAHGQDYTYGVPLSAVELLQYQGAKVSGRKVVSPFRKYQFKRIGARKVVEEKDSVQLWGYKVGANMEFDKEKQPLYRLFRCQGGGAMAVIDHVGGDDQDCLLVFWDKQIYRRYATQLRRAGFVLRDSKENTNVLEFRREGTTVGVDVEIWHDIYILYVRKV